MNIYDYIKENDFDKYTDLKIISELLGIDVATDLIKAVGGCTVIIPKIQSIKPVTQRFVAELHPDYEAKFIARVLNLNERTVRSIIRAIGK